MRYCSELDGKPFEQVPFFSELTEIQPEVCFRAFAECFEGRIFDDGFGFSFQKTSHPLTDFVLRWKQCCLIL